MRILIFIFLCAVSTEASAKTIEIKPGDAVTCSAERDVVQCKESPTCNLKKNYVSQKWEIQLPDGSNHGEYPDRAGAMAELKNLLSIKVCDKTDIKSN